MASKQARMLSGGTKLFKACIFRKMKPFEIFFYKMQNNCFKNTIFTGFDKVIALTGMESFNVSGLALRQYGRL